MSEKSDAQLLREYVQDGAEAAFAEIVVRHTDLVYSSALRQVGSSDLAADVAQSVFTDLARKGPSLAGTLQSEASLLGWLYRSTRFAALNQLRNDRRRQAREKHAMDYIDPNPEPAPEWEHARPVLDEAMVELNEQDREALLLRFFSRHDFKTIGRCLGVSDDVAQKRVSRALEKLRAHLTARGVTTSAAFSVMLSANAVSVAPTGLASTLSTASLAAAGASASASTSVAFTTITGTKAIAMTTAQKFIIGATLAAAVGTGIYQTHQSGLLRQQLRELRQARDAKNALLESEREQGANHLAALRAETNRLGEKSLEVSRLRAEIARLQREQQLASERPLPSAAQLPTSNPTTENSSATVLAKESWADRGFGTPHDALKTRGWAVANGNRERFKTSLHITETARKTLEDAFIQMAEASKDPNKGKYLEEVLQNKFGVEEGILMPMMSEDQTRGYRAYRILSEKQLSNEQMLLEVQTTFASGPARTEQLKFQRFGEDWKIVIDEEFVRKVLPPGS